eukprot:NODE_31_length_32452_cov_0.352672.p20 type:complete len:182 gc:universal NODE_31_length_32452_cov_0.352672:16583-16038(-)
MVSTFCTFQIMLKSWSENEERVFLELNASWNSRIHLFDSHLKVYDGQTHFYVLFLEPIVEKLSVISKSSGILSFELKKKRNYLWGVLEAPNKKELWKSVVMNEKYENNSFSIKSEEEQRSMFVRKAMEADAIRNKGNVQPKICRKMEYDYDTQLRDLDTKIDQILFPLKSLPIRSYFKLQN